MTVSFHSRRSPGQEFGNDNTLPYHQLSIIVRLCYGTRNGLEEVQPIAQGESITFSKVPVMFFPSRFEITSGEGLQFDRFISEVFERSSHPENLWRFSTPAAIAAAKAIASDNSAAPRLRFAIVSSLTHPEDAEQQDRLAFLSLLSFTTQESRLGDVSNWLRGHTSTQHLFLLNDLITILSDDSCDLNSPELRQLFSKLNGCEFRIPFVLPRGDERILSVAEEYFSDRDLEDYPQLAGKITTRQVFDDLRNNVVTTLPRVLRQKLFQSLFGSIRMALLRIHDDEARRSAFSLLQGDVESLFIRMLKCDSVEEILEGKAIYLDCLRSCGLAEKEIYEWQNPKLKQIDLHILEFAESIEDRGSGSAFVHNVNEIARLWELEMREIP